ncbi:MAG: hypothetical protein ABJK11_12760 [Balneola sp.]
MVSKKYESKFDFVDDFSLTIEELGHPRIYGEILGWLLICNPPHQSFPDLMVALDISKASVSNITRLMLGRGIIEKVRVKGERQIYFKLKEGSIIDFMDKQLELTVDLKEIISNGLDLLESDKETDSSRMKVANEFHEFLAQEIPSLIRKYKKKRGFTE